MFLQNFIDEQKRLLNFERSEEVNQSKIISESSPKVLEEKNLCIRKLRIVNIFTGLYGRTIIEFESKQKSDDNSKRIFTQGDIIGICIDSSKNDSSKSIATGLYYKSTKDCIQIALDNDPEEGVDLRESDSTLFRLVKLSSEITYQRLKAGLKYLEKRANPLCGDYLIDLLMGEGTLRSTEPQKPITFINENLNESQREAVSFALSRPDLAIVHGPPGTGKTTVAVEIISQVLCRNRSAKVLVCTPSNIALDNLAEKLIKVILPLNSVGKKDRRIDLLRLGHSARVKAHLGGISLDHRLAESDQAELIREVRLQIDSVVKRSAARRGGYGELRDLRRELREREMKAVREVLAKSQVVLSTLTGLRSNKQLPLNEVEFDVVLIDEASQAIEAASWLAVPRGRRLILAGDHKQLPPTVLSPEALKAGLGLSLMERLLTLFPDHSLTTRMLSCQYRMHLDIMRWSSDTFYRSELVAHDSVAEHVLSDICTDAEPEGVPLSPLVFLDTAGCGLWELTAASPSPSKSSSPEESRANPAEAHLTAVVIRDLVHRYQLRPDQIGVITPYSRQVPLVRQCLRDRVDLGHDFDLGLLEVSTVDGFQGREKEVIVISLVRSNPRGAVGFLAESRRLNVALTRAKRHLCVIGDSGTMRRSRDAALCSLVDYWEAVAEVRSARDCMHAEDIVGGDCGKASTGGPKKGEKKDEKRSDKNEEKKLCDRVRSFKANEAVRSLEFSADLTPRLRAVLHELCEQLQLTHVSVGAGADRRLTVSKPATQSSVAPDRSDTGSETVLLAEEIDNGDLETCKSEEELQSSSVPTETETEVIEVVKVSSEKIDKVDGNEKTSSDVLREKSDRLGQMLRAKASDTKAQPTVKVAAKSAKKKAAKKESVVGELSEDFDTLMEQFQRMNTVCQFPGKTCSALVAVLGFDCRFCKRRFCAAHAQPEVHECRRVSVAEWRADSAAQRPVSKKQQVRHAQLSIAMARKINGLAAERAGHGDPKK